MEEEKGMVSQFGEWYAKIHGPFITCVCILGIATNILNVIVFTRRTMVTTTHYILASLALVDMLTLLSYLPYALYFYCLTSPDPSYGHEKGWIIYLLFNTNFSITTRNVATCLTAVAALFPYGQAIHKKSSLMVAVLASVIASICVCVLSYIMYKLQRFAGQGWWFAENDFITPPMRVANFWIFIVLRVVPCALFFTLIIWLVFTIYRIKLRRQIYYQTTVDKERSEQDVDRKIQCKAMVLAVMITFIITELPAGIIAIFSSLDSNNFVDIYVPLGDVFDAMILINCAIHFMLYCSVSSHFRNTFNQVVHVQHAAPSTFELTE